MKFKSPQERNKFVNECVQAGMTYAKIAEILGISRQRVWQLFHGMRMQRLDKSVIHKPNDDKALQVN